MSYEFTVFLQQRFTEEEVHLNCKVNIKLTAVKQAEIYVQMFCDR